MPDPRELERNLLAVAMQGELDTACRVILALTEDDLSEPHGRWLWAELAKRVGLGHKYHDLLPYADEQQAAYLDELQSRYITSGTADSLLEGVKRQTRLRKARVVLAAGLERISRGEDGAVEEILAELAQVVTPGMVRRIHGARDILLAAKKRIEDMQSGKLAPYLNVGMPALEKLLAIQPGQLVILGAGTGVGKTALALTWVYAVAFVRNQPTLYLNSEMAPEEIGLRLVSIAKGIPHGRLRVNPEEGDWLTVCAMADDYADAPAFTSEPIGELSSAEVVALTRYHRATSDIKLLVVDYIQRLRDWKQRDMPQWQMFMEISRALKILAADEKIIALCLAQFNSMGELAASKGMANDADLVLGLERCGENGPPAHKDQTHLLTVLKGRHIPTGLEFPLRMDPHTLRFREAQR